MISVWADGSPAGSCPSGMPIACNDDGCYLFSLVTFNSIAGRGYFLQFGEHFPGATYSGSFTIGGSFGPPPNDDCSSPDAITGPGPHLYDCTFASAGTQGQNEALCNYFATTAVNHDVWFIWNAPVTGTYRFSLCGGASYDTKAVVYPGYGCPSAPASACRDDQCALEPAICFSAVAGAQYTLQIGTYPGAVTAGFDTFRVDLYTPPPSCQYDNGTTENALGLTLGGQFAWLQRFGAPGTSTTVYEIESAFGSAAYPGVGPPAGTPVLVGVWDDPNDDGNPSDLFPLGIVSGTITNVDNDVRDAFALCPPVLVQGVYFVGVAVIHGSGQFPLPLDQDSCPLLSLGRSWLVGAPGGLLDLSNLAASPVPPTDLDVAGFPGVTLLRANCSTAAPTGTISCAGDGTGTACPCGNTGAPQHGCGSSVNPAGAQLLASCTASLSADSLTLTATGLPNGSVGLYMQGTQLTALVFGDGVRCAGGTIVRLATKPSPTGASQYPGPGDTSISLRSATYFPPQPIAPGNVRHYLVWYRNSAAFCTPATFNLTNSVTIPWSL